MPDVGFNCTRGPQGMIEILRTCIDAVKIPLAALPVTYRTDTERPTMQSLTDPSCCYMDLEPHLCTRFEMEDFACEAAELGARYLGVCCGASPYHLRAMAKSLNIDCPARDNDADLGKHFALGKKENVQEQQFFT